MTDKSIPSGGPDLPSLLSEVVVIDGSATTVETGARSIEPDHSPRSYAPVTNLPAAGLVSPGSSADSLQREVEQFLFRQSELLDGKHWQAYIDLFDEQGVYWMPVNREQTEWEGYPSIFAEDKTIMTIRMGRVLHPNAWSQAPQWETNHVVGNVAIESVDGDSIHVRSRFQMMELRRDTIRHFGGTYRHHLVRQKDGGLKIRLQRVDLFNGQAVFEYVLQVWV